LVTRVFGNASAFLGTARASCFLAIFCRASLGPPMPARPLPAVFGRVEVQAHLGNVRRGDPSGLPIEQAAGPLVALQGRKLREMLAAEHGGRPVPAAVAGGGDEAGRPVKGGEPPDDLRGEG